MELHFLIFISSSRTKALDWVARDENQSIQRKKIVKRDKLRKNLSFNTIDLKSVYLNRIMLPKHLKTSSV